MAGLFEGRSVLRILDVGCGSAQNRSYFTEHGHQYIGLDLCTLQADVRADSMCLPFRDRTFDAIISIAALQYAWNPYRALCEAYRVLTPGGTLTGTTAFLEPWTFEGLIHLTPGGLIELLSRAHFDIEHIWAGWNVGPAIHTYAFQPAYSLGKCIGAMQHVTHRMWWRCINMLRRMTGRTPPPISLFELDFAAAICFHAVKPRSTVGPADLVIDPVFHPHRRRVPCRS